ncbi:MAG TPA: zinc-binding dehydrogenase [Blastocatellia bacterium]|nr:zinc-binding dehydrogenase [Blastocatellia bacterium]
MTGKTMKAAIITAPGTVSLEEIKRFAPGPGEVLVRCRATAICTAERRAFSGVLPFYPMIGGHELAGVVEEVNDPDTTLKPGDRIAVDTHIRCGSCYYCLKGLNNQCVRMYETPKDSQYVVMGGGFAEYATVPSRQAIRLPEQVTLEEASVLEPLACCVRSIKKAGLSFGDTVLIVGAGTMGSIQAMLARMMGAYVIISDIDEVRLKQAEQLGADLTVNPSTEDLAAVVRDHTEGRGADVVIVATSVRQAGEQGLACVGRAGRLIFYASLHPKSMLELDWNRVHSQEIIITGSVGATHRDFREAVALLSQGSVNLKPLISRYISLEQLPEELASKPAGETQRVVVRL